MATVHETAIIQGEVELADDVAIGPNCVLDGTIGHISVGSGTRLIGNGYLTGPLTIGQNNTVYPFACLGFSPQDLKWDPAHAGAGTIIGDGNTFREHVTIHRATENAPTTIGSNNYFMACAHVGHDCLVSDHCIFANATALGGFVRVDERVTIGGGTVVHQFVRLGRGSMLSGAVGAAHDLPPFFMLTGISIAGSLNVIGMRRSKMAAEVVADIRWVYKTLYRRGLSVKSAIQVMRERIEVDPSPIIAEYIEFITSSRRGICSGAGKSVRGVASEMQVEQ